MAAGIGESILYIAGLIVAATFLGVFGNIIADAGTDVQTQASRVEDGLYTDVVWLSDPQEVDASPLVLVAKNTGTRTVSTPDMFVLIDGVASSNVTFDVLASVDDEAWTPASTLRITVNDVVPTSGEHTARIITASGVEAVMTFDI